MTTPTPPFAVINGILARTRHLLLDFDGVVCHLYAAQTRSLAADRLRAVLSSHGAPLPEAIIPTTDPLAVLSFAATISSELAGQADADFVDCELDAISSAEPMGYRYHYEYLAQSNSRPISSDEEQHPWNR